MNKVVISVLVVVLAMVIGILVFLGFNIPNAGDSLEASAVCRHIAEKYGKFWNRRLVEQTDVGKIYYWRSGSYYPMCEFYGVVEPQDIMAIEAYAIEACKVVGARKVKLTFYERQNWQSSQNGGESRSAERVIKEITVAP